jgi:hypothetical protein
MDQLAFRVVRMASAVVLCLLPANPLLTKAWSSQPLDNQAESSRRSGSSQAAAITVPEPERKLMGILESPEILLGELPPPSAVNAPPDRQSSFNVPTINSAQANTKPANYHSTSMQSLGAREVGCRSAMNWQPARTLRSRAATTQSLYCDQSECKQQAAAAIARFLSLHAAAQEDIAAASAMRAYYTRIALALQLEKVAAGTKAINDQQAKQKSLMEQGNAAGVDLSLLERQLMDVEDRRLQIVSQDDQLRRLLLGLASIDYESGSCAVEPLSIERSMLDCDSLIRQALASRHDLMAWRTLQGQINEESAPMLLAVVSSAAGGFGIPVPSVAAIKLWLCHKGDNAALAEGLRRELSSIVRFHESFIGQTVYEKCQQLRLAYDRWELQQRKLDSWKQRLIQLEKLSEYGEARPKELAEVRAGIVQAESEEIVRRMDAKLAEVALAEAVGCLAHNCCQGAAWLPLGQ